MSYVDSAARPVIPEEIFLRHERQVMAGTVSSPASSERRLPLHSKRCDPAFPKTPSRKADSVFIAVQVELC